MSTHEVSTNNHGGEDVPQPNELVVDEGGSQNISEAVEEPPTKTVVLEVLDGLREADNQMISTVKEALKNFEYGYHQIRKNCVEEAIKKIEEAAEEPPTKRSKIVEETLQMKDVEINLLRKQIKDYARERREMMKYINYIETLLHVSCTPHSKANQSWIN